MPSVVVVTYDPKYQVWWILLCHENGAVNLIGGTRNQNEGHLAAALRETHEEAKIHPDVVKSMFVNDFSGSVCYAKVARSYIYIAYVPFQDHQTFLQKYSMLVRNARTNYSLPHHERELDDIQFYRVDQLGSIYNKSQYLKDAVSELQRIPGIVRNAQPGLLGSSYSSIPSSSYISPAPYPLVSNPIHHVPTFVRPPFTSIAPITPFTPVPVPSVKGCRAPGCTSCRPGQKHYCDRCGKNDADHRARNCPFNPVSIPHIPSFVGSSAPMPRGQRCRALGCTSCQPGQAHYCKNCKVYDVTHRRFNCPMLKQKMCRAPGCTSCQPGWAHYCKNCKVYDVDHRSFNCPRLRQRSFGM